MTLTLTAGGASIAFGTTTGYGLYGEVARRFTAARRVVRDVPYGPSNPFVDALVTGEIEWTLSAVRVTGTGPDDLALLLKNLNAMLTVAGTVTDGLSGGATAVTWTRNPSLPLLPGRTQHLEARSVWEGDVTFYTTVMGYAAIAGLVADSAVSPRIATLGSLVGDAPAPLDTIVSADWDTTANGIRDCVVAVCDTGTLSDYVYPATGASGWATSSGAHRTNSATWDDDDYGAVPAGRWRVFALAHRENAETGYLSLSDDGADALQSVALTTINYRLYNLGEWISTGIEHLHVLGKGSDYSWVYRLVLVPATNYTSYAYDDGGSVAVWTLGAAPTFTMDDATVIPAVKYMTGGRLFAKTSGQYLLVSCADQAGSDLSPSVTLDVDYTPQHYTWASS
jgi:hypothetical protein